MSSFHERQKNLFNLLKDAEEQYSFSKSNKVTTTQDYGTIDRKSYRKLKHEMKQFRGKQSIFKRPEANIRECLETKAVPDHVKNPEKWKYYSLSDVTTEQMSDATNTATALAFIKELEEKHEDHRTEQEKLDDDIFKKPRFNFSTAIKKRSEEKRAIVKGGKVIMPEYVVGMSKKKEKKNTLVIKKQSKETEACKKIELKLDHLYEEDN